MKKVFPATSAEILEIGTSLITHLKNLQDTHGQKDWTTANLESLRTFTSHGLDLKHFPPSVQSNQKDAFLWDYIGYQQGGGILIVAESEHNNKSSEGLKHDFEKLFYAVAPIKLFMFLGDRDEHGPTEKIVNGLRDYMSECCSRFMPGELYILYCRTWLHADSASGDRAYILQVPGEPSSTRRLDAEDKFHLI